MHVCMRDIHSLSNVQESQLKEGFVLAHSLGGFEHNVGENMAEQNGSHSACQSGNREDAWAFGWLLFTFSLIWDPTL